MSAGIEEYRSRLREALNTINQLKAKLEAVTKTRTEPIAIIGMACRFPGGGSTPERFFDALLDGVDAVTEVPSNRWKLDAPVDDPQKRAIRWGAFIDDVEQFDAEFFGISPREAARLDPQQRLLLEIAWEALENAGIVPSRLVGSRTGVFIGLMTNDYALINSQASPDEQDVYSVTGNGHAFPAGRISYTLGLQGPSMVVDTACSSSLVAAHLASHSLRTGESDLALVGGVNLILAPEMMEQVARTRALSPDGRCKTFDASANGYVRGEGCGVLVLKRLADAQRAGDPILALIRGSAVNQDGRSTGLTTPNVLAQETLIRAALANAGLTADEIGFVEAHGTGTPLGDPIEIDALKAVLGQPRADGSKCVIGAVKTNIGHLEAGAGLAGLIKTIQIFRRSMIPRNANFRFLNPRIELDDSSLTLATSNQPWVRGNKPRRAGVSSFGLSGTNAHVILEDVPPTIAEPAPPPRSAHLLPISARGLAGVATFARSCAEWLSAAENANLSDICFTASVRRPHHEYRAAAVAGSGEEFVSILSKLGRGEMASGVVASPNKVQTQPQVVFIFPGQGSQWIGMGQQLIRDEPVFRKAIEDCDHAIRAEAGFSIIEQIGASEDQSRLGEIDVVQPSLFAVEVAIATLWQSWGIVPDFVVGHSMGEIAAAHVSGMLGLRDAVKIICRRSRLMKQIRGRGAMALVELPLSEAERLLSGYDSRVSVAASNGPRSTILSGDPDALNVIIGELETQGIFCRRVKVDVASHSPQVDSFRSELLIELNEIAPGRGSIPMYSTVHAQPVLGPELNAVYWAENLRKPVQFSRVIRALLEYGRTIFLEISPHPILLPSIQEHLKETGGTSDTVESLRRQVDEQRTLLEALGKLYVCGVSIAWERLFPQRGNVVEMPAYPWQRERFWSEPLRYLPASRHTADYVHPLLGARLRSTLVQDALIWQAHWDLNRLPYLADHCIGEQIVVPGAAYIDAAIFALFTQVRVTSILVQNIAFLQPLALEAGKTVLVEICLIPVDTVQYQFRFSSCDDVSSDNPSWTLHATANVCRDDTTLSSVPLSIQQMKQDRNHEISGEIIGQLGHDLGLRLGDAFKGISQLWRNQNELVGRLALPPALKAQAASHFVHPVLLDSALRTLALEMSAKRDGHFRVLASIDRIRISARIGDAVWSHGRLPDGDSPTNLALFDDSNRELLLMEGIKTQPIVSVGNKVDSDLDLFYGQEWRRLDLVSHQSRTKGRWLVLCDMDGIGEQISVMLVERGATVEMVWARQTTWEHAQTRRSVDPGEPEQVAALIAEMIAHHTQLQGIVYCWGIEKNAPATISSQSLDAAQINGCAGALHFVQALLHATIRDMPRLWLITRATQAIPDMPADVDVTHAPLWGLGRTIAVEFPELRCGRIDIETLGQTPIEMIINELTADGDEEEIAFRNGQRFIGRLAQRRPSLNAPHIDLVSSEATYLITGGLGGLGLVAAKWLVNAGARHLVLMGRQRPSTPEQNEHLTALETMGARIFVAQADVSITEDVAAILQHVRDRMPPLRGIVHTAGVLDDGALIGQTFARFKKVLAPKMLGAWNLHLLTQDMPIDFFVLYSSMAALMGPAGLGNYVAANTFLDTLAHYRHNKGLAATSINWGLFADLGMGWKAQSVGRSAEQGIRGLTSDIGESMFLHAIREHWVQMGIADMNFRTWRESHPQVASLRRFEMIAGDAANASTTLKKDTQLHNALVAATAADRSIILERFVRETLAAILRMDPSRIERFAPLRTLGIDSLMSLELRNRLDGALGLQLSATLAFTHPHVAALVEHLLQVLPAPPAESPIHVPAPSPTMTAEPMPAVDDDDLLKAFDDSMKRAKTRRKA